MIFLSLAWRWLLGKLRILSGRDVGKLLADGGFVEVRRRRSHIVMQKSVGYSTITVPVPDHALQSIIRQSGVMRERFEV